MKKEIINTVEATEDEVLLEQCFDILKSSGSDNYSLSEPQIQRVQEAIAQYERGEYLTDEAAEKELDEWFKED